MPEVNVTPNKRRDRVDDTDSTTTPGEVAGARKRRAFLQTMGQQLREFGVDGTSPQDHSRVTFGASPSNHRPASRSANLVANQPHLHTIDTPESDAAPGEDDSIPAGAAKSASKWLWRANEVHLPQVTTSTPTLLFDDLLDWSQSYFDHWHPAFPFLHAPLLIDHMRHVTHTGMLLPAPSPLEALQHVILRSVMSISVADRRQMNTSCKPIPAVLTFHSFNDAINSVQLVLTEESSIMSLQALVSVQLFLITMHRYNAAYICIRLGTPLGIRSEEMDVCFPHDERHNKADDAENGRTQHDLRSSKNDTDSTVKECDDRLILLEFLARHASIRGVIMETRNKSAMRSDYNEAEQSMEMDAEHTKWWNTVDEYLSADEGTHNIIKAHQVALLVLRFESVLALHRSVLAKSRKSSAYNAALQRCISASRSIINTLHKAISGFGAFDGSPGQRGYESTPLVWPSFTWAVWMSIFIIVFAATEGQVARDTAIRLSDKSVQILQHLALRGTSWPEACVVAVQNLVVRLKEGSARNSTAPSRAPSRQGHPLASTLRTESQHQHRPPQGDINTEATGQHHQQSQQQAVHGRPARIPPGIFQNPVSRYTSQQFQHETIPRGNDTYNIPEVYTAMNEPHAINPAYLGGVGNFLGIAQQSSDNPIPNDEIMHLFDGEDMGLWFSASTNYGGIFPFQNANLH
ncbi:hypothetical protein CC86DRAFT_347570 [Ophiobolus disseminans]|uniref:Transcription factor domain-containing protein n=1 Tax=Ophiobolus disseminans TaxID=1469910 RepID=A0A6A7A4T1_9PLEO|nr:hypothetical protein CC86DRAFT_347570 [Ophiobolus disseminans]